MQLNIAEQTRQCHRQGSELENSTIFLLHKTIGSVGGMFGNADSASPFACQKILILLRL
jgi:hypothetical protein